MLQDTTGGGSIPVVYFFIGIYHPPHSLYLHLVISPIGFLFPLMYHTMGIGNRPFGRDLYAVVFQCFLLIWPSNYLCMALMNYSLSDRAMDSSRVILSMSHEAFMEITT